MTISERIFDLIKMRGMTQKDFSEKTGIAQSSISDWKRKKTNPVSEKILIICEVLNVTPYELLGGTDGVGSRSNPSEMIILEKDSELGRMVVEYSKLSKPYQNRILGYMKALQEFELTVPKPDTLKGNNSNNPYKPLAREEMIEQLAEARMHADEGRVKDPYQASATVRAKYGL